MLVKPILILLPCKGKPEKIEGFYETWRKTTSGYSDLLTCLDDDDPVLDEYRRHKDVSFDVGKGTYMCDSLNRAFKRYPKYKYYYMVADDIRLRTCNWEESFMNKIEKNGGKGIAYGNDLMFGESLATAPFVSGNIFRALGFLALPGLFHMWIDKFWYELGKGLDKLFYFPDIIAEHIHYSLGKSPIDSWYLRVNNKKVNEHDGKIFQKWYKEQMKKDIAKIKAYRE